MTEPEWGPWQEIGRAGWRGRRRRTTGRGLSQMQYDLLTTCSLCGSTSSWTGTVPEGVVLDVGEWRIFTNPAANHARPLDPPDLVACSQLHAAALLARALQYLYA